MSNKHMPPDCCFIIKHCYFLRDRFIVIQGQEVLISECLDTKYCQLHQSEN